MPGAAREISLEKKILNKKKNLIFLSMLKNVSQFCQGVWPAIANKYIYMSEELYNIDKILLKMI